MTEERKEFDRYRRKLKKEKGWPGIICARCGQFEKSGHLHHIVPLRKGGENGVDNLVPLCHCCHEDIERYGHTGQTIEEFIKIPDQFALDIGIRSGLFCSEMTPIDAFSFLLKAQREIAAIKYEEKREEDWPEYWELWEDERRTFPHMAEIV